MENDLKILRTLRQYESVSLVEDKYTRRHTTEEANKEKIRSIVFNIKQAKGLFQSAATSDYLTRPVEQYYGILAFCRAMLLFLDPEMDEQAIKSKHGLKFSGLPRQIGSVREILDLKIKVDGGFFEQWARQSHKKVAMRNASNQPKPYEGFYDEDMSGWECDLGSLVSLLPDLRSELEQLTGKSLSYLKPDYRGDNIELQVVGSLEGINLPRYISRCFGGIDEAKVKSVGGRKWIIDRHNIAETTLPQFVQLYHDAFGLGMGSILIAPTTGKKISPMTTMLTIAYAMSMLARYRPSIWGKMWHIGGTDAAFPLMEQAMDLVQNAFPLSVVDNMRRVE